MAPREDIIIRPSRVQIEHAIPPPPPPPGRLQRPPHDHPAAYLDRQNTRRNNTPSTQTPTHENAALPTKEGFKFSSLSPNIHQYLLATPRSFTRIAADLVRIPELKVACVNLDP